MTTRVSDPTGPLQGITVLDIGGEITNYCGRMFAQLGADVVLVEPVTGSSYRRAAPLAASTGDSLRFAYDNSDKRGLGLDIASPGGREVLERLLASADLILDDRTELDLAAHGLPHERLSHLFPGLTTTVVTPFGLQGPYADYVATDATCMAFGGMLWLGGYEDGPPVVAAGRQAYRAGSLFAAVASMAALVADDGAGELIDVSVQECVSLGLENAIQYWDLERHVRRRHGGKQKQAGFGVFPCADGYVFLIAGGIGGNRFWNNFVAWLKDEGVSGAEELERDRWWERGFVESTEGKDLFWEIFTPYSSAQPKAALLEAALRWNVPLSPLKTMSEVHQSPQLQARDFFSTVRIGETEADAPGAPYRFSDSPWRSDRPAPHLGQHTRELLTERGYSLTDIETMLQKKEIA